MLSVETGTAQLFEQKSNSNVTLSGYRAKNEEEIVDLLKDDFFLYPNRGTVCQVKLSKTRIIYEKPGVLGGDSKKVCLDIWDVVGVIVGRQKGRNRVISETKIASKTKSDNGAYLCLYAYPYNKPHTEGGIRQKKEVIFRFCKHDSYEENLEVVQKWRIAIDLLLKNIEVNNVSDIEASRLPSRPRKLLIFINPHSGRSKAVQIFNKEVKPVLNHAGIKFEVIVTSRQNHAREKVSQMDLKDCHDGIVIVSGDGLVYEVINGLMDRPDKQTALQVPIGVIPAGSGNAMSSAILGRLGEGYHKNRIVHAAFILTKPGAHPLDLITLETQYQKSISFLSIAWGIIADIDIESERYRFLGAARFTFGALVRILNLRIYHGKLSYLPVENTSEYEVNKMTKSPYNPRAKSKDSNGVIHADDNVQRQHITRHHSTYQMKEDAELVDVSPSRSIPRHFTVTQGLSEQGDFSFSDRFDPASVNTNAFTRQPSDENGYTKHQSEDGDDSGFQLDASQPEPLDSSSSGEDTSPLEESGGSGGSPKDPSGEGFSSSLLPPLSKPVPSNWEVLEGEFVGIVITYMSHLSQDVVAWPNREFDEGCLSIQFVPVPATRKNLLDLMEAFTDGSHIEKELVQVRYCKAFRLEPYTENGLLTVDGEKIEYGTVQAEVMPNLKGMILTPPRRR